MKRLSAKLTYANVISTLCLVLVVGGGTAYAATKMLPKNSVGSRQIKNAAVTPAKLSKASKAALTGAAGPQGATGSQGPKGDPGQKGEPGPVVESLPSGKTLRGQYSFADHKVSGNSPVNSISFPLPLASAPSDHIIPVEGAPTPECPGTAGAPSAAPGNGCIYETKAEGAIEEDNLGEVENGRFGFTIFVPLVAGTDWEVEGTWAVTAP
jgi:hypothetical protein